MRNFSNFIQPDQNQQDDKNKIYTNEWYKYHMTWYNNNFLS